jgi:SAM-dependent methyltransferase
MARPLPRLQAATVRAFMILNANSGLNCGMHADEPGLADHRDRLKWNARYAGRPPSFDPHPLAVLALSKPLPVGPVLELASGPSGSALLAAGTGRAVTAVDAADLALRLLAGEAARRGLAGRLTVVHADLRDWRPAPSSFALVLCTGYWDPALFGAAAAAVLPGGLLAWEALTASARLGRPALNPAWCLGPGEPASLLPAGFTEVSELDPAQASEGARRRLLARRDLVL